MPDVDLFDYDAPPNLLAGRTILVSGASRGIGAEAARCYAAHGAQVILLGRNAASLEVIRQQITEAGHPQPWVQVLDLETADDAEHAALAVHLARHIDSLDGLLHNASLLGPRTELAEIPGDSFARVMQVNVNAAFMLTRALLPLLKRSTQASIIFTSSSVGRKGRAGWGAYGVSKFATEGLMQTLAAELVGSTVRANSLNPGATRTAMRQQAYPQENPLDNPTPAQIMPLYLYLMGRDSQAINGQALSVRR